MASCIITEIKDHFRSVKNWQAALLVSLFGMCFGSIYYTQSGLSILSLVDHYGATFVAFNLVIFELCTFCYIYGVDRLCLDVQFMLKFRPSFYWRICWRFLTPALTLFLVVYYYNELFTGEDENNFPFQAKIVGYILATSALCQLPLIMIYEIYKSDGKTLTEKIKKAFSPLSNWGPRDEKLQLTYQQYLLENRDLM
jgi:solute carrier family 6 (neurotransmitter transporter, glycine) member 5/9